MPDVDQEVLDIAPEGHPSIVTTPQTNRLLEVSREHH